MEPINGREDEIFQFLQPYMQECIKASCQSVQIEMEILGNEIWDELKNVICKILDNVTKMQKQHKKKDIKYFVFSFMRYGIYLNKFELRIDALDESFYLDEQESAGYYSLDFLQNKYLEDYNYLCKKTKEKFIRLQNYELIGIKKWYADFYNSIIFQVIKSLTELIMEVIVESGVGITDDFKIIYGEYMDRAIVLGTKEKYEREIFSD